jgi:hypothetical protein
MTRTQGWMVYDCPQFTFDIDEYLVDEKQMIFTHLRFHNWSPSAFKLFRTVFNTFRKAVDCPLYAFSEDASAKFTRFVTLMGYEPLPCTVVADNGERRALFVSYKD